MCRTVQVRARAALLAAALLLLASAASADGDAPWQQLAKKYQLGTWTAAFNAEQGIVPDGLQKAAGGFSRPKHLIWPVKGGRFGRGFGSGKGGRHKALDIVAPTGTAIKSAFFGVVLFAGERKGYGKTIVILHTGKWVTLYAHCSKLKVKPGMKVKTGQKIALVGSTGISRGPHLHWELRIKGQQADPAPYVHPSIPHPPHVGPLPWVGYTVKKGDTPTKIAKKKKVDAATILKINFLKSGSKLQAGWKIALPIKVKGKKKSSKNIYVVQNGDTLGSIAVLYDVKISALKSLNGIDDADKIFPGQKINLPAGSYDGHAITKKKIANKAGYLWHEVQVGESLFSIAKKYNTSITVIANLNGIKDKDKLKEGQKLKVPKPPKKKKKKKKKKKGGAT
ncbi:MAG: LysM peptidoglycan-binding domain-containing protein [Deltaproteobacteria bacterium]|nr:LysM peptidoglycan-binding domain-containing protein [Deltaproteobacteria bacterium]